MPVVVVPYDPAWPERFAAERDLLAERLRPWLRGGVHHIGSTAVPGLAAKPVLDMIAGIKDLGAAGAVVPVLERLGYAHAEHPPAEALWFHRPAGVEPALHTHHLHLTEVGSDLWRERLGFRDALRADPALRQEYELLKRRLAAQQLTGSAYAAGKRAFVARVLAGVGVPLR